MIIPGSSIAVFIILTVGMLAWGLWANTLKAAGDKWRFELYCFDFALGAAFAAMVLALTLGSLGFDGFSFIDELGLAGKRQDMFAFIGGGIFNLGNMLLLGAVSLAGMSLAFPAAMGIAAVVAAVWDFTLNPGGKAAFVFGGGILAIAAVVLDLVVLKNRAAAQQETRIEPGKAKPKKKASAVKGVFLCIASGLFIGSCWPFIEMARSDENGLGPYSLGVFFCIGLLLSTFVFNLFFMNLPVQGEPLDIGKYLRSKWKLHTMGMLGGIVWYVGLLSGLVAARAEGTAKVGAPASYAFTEAGVVIAALCGLFLWGELDSADASLKSRSGLAIVLLAVGIAVSAFGMAPAR